jgi:hypothetical protein
MPPKGQRQRRRPNQKQLEEQRKKGIVSGTFQCHRCGTIGFTKRGGKQKHWKACKEYGARQGENIVAPNFNIDAFLIERDAESSGDELAQLDVPVTPPIVKEQMRPVVPSE